MRLTAQKSVIFVPSDFGRNSKNANATAKDPRIRTILSEISILCQKHEVGRRRIVCACSRACLVLADNSSLFNEIKHYSYQREKCTLDEISSSFERFFISIDRRSCGVGEIVYLCVEDIPKGSCDIPESRHEFTGRKLSRLKYSSEACIAIHWEFFHCISVGHFGSTATFGFLSRFKRVYGTPIWAALARGSNDRMCVLW